MRKKRNNKPEIPDRMPVQETVGGITISPETDIPFGKQFVMGCYEYTIYERATEQGYQAGIAAHLDLIRHQGGGAPFAMDDAGFVLILDTLTPKDLPTHDRSMWRAHFIAGWSAVFLGLVRD
jgi:hypothetical protein